MTIDEMINQLTKLKEKIGGEHQVPCVIIDWGENDYVIPEYATIGNFVDQDGETYKCALVGHYGGEEFTEDGIEHYKWKPTKFE
jgi:hypothetical protein